MPLFRGTSSAADGAATVGLQPGRYLVTCGGRSARSRWSIYGHFLDEGDRHHRANGTHSARRVSLRAGEGVAASRGSKADHTKHENESRR